MYFAIRMTGGITKVSQVTQYVCSHFTDLFSPPGKRNKSGVRREMEVYKEYIPGGHMKNKSGFVRRQDGNENTDWMSA